MVKFRKVTEVLKGANIDENMKKFISVLTDISENQLILDKNLKKIQENQIIQEKYFIAICKKLGIKTID